MLSPFFNGVNFPRVRGAECQHRGDAQQYDPGKSAIDVDEQELPLDEAPG